ncbi:hypothetical protein GGI15_002789 [Coemansia interrupta]|uniref:Enoyl reductase (ER) domain-containing protein n=1 Tax=Coemansia interrupta TaxID=1126814 RepID=A0A9W8HDA9_9FUNG|nr:hypothetical protein GGI15_002789 [Coemansia interrupta]
MSPETYQAAVVDKYTGDPLDFHLAQVPRHATLQPTQVEVQVHAASLNPIDYKRAEGMLSLFVPEPFPLLLGYDFAGLITRVGPSVHRFSPGDRVYGRAARADAGAIAEYFVTQEVAVARIPGNVSFNVAAAVPLAGLTALQSLERLGVTRESSVFVSAGMGGVGMFGVALARHHFGAKEVITTVSTGKVERAREMGATRVVDYTQENYTEVLEDAADVMLDTTGDTESYRVVKPNSRVVSVAMMPDSGGLEYFRKDQPPLSLVGRAKFAVLKRVVGVASWVLTRGFRAKGIRYEYVVMEPNGRQLEEVFNPLLENGVIKPVIANVHAFTNQGIQDAFRESRDGHATGKIIVCIKG